MAPPGVTFRAPNAALEAERRPLPMHRLLALALPLVLAACSGLENEPDNQTGNPGTGLRIGVLTRPEATPTPGDTLTFYVTFPDSVSTRYRTSWYMDQRGTQLPGGCTRSVCIKWIIPAGDGTYQHSVQVAGNGGISSVPFTTVVP